MRIVLYGVVCCLLSPFAWTQANPEEQPKTETTRKNPHVAETMVVTANLHNQESFDTNLPVNVLTEADLKLTLPANLVDLLANEPGIAVSRTGNGSVRPMIRGLYDERVLTLMNGIRQSEQFGGGNHTYSIEPGMIQSVEIVRGPASVTYGTDAVGGVLNCFTKGYGMSRTPANELSTLFRSGSTGTRQSMFYSMGNDRMNGFVDLVRTDFDDVETPDGPLPNSAMDGLFANVGLNYVDDHHQFMLNYYTMKGDIGIPVNPDAVAMGFRNNRYKRLQAEYTRTDISPVIRGVAVSVATQYKHRHMYIEVPTSEAHNGSREIFLNKSTRNLNAHAHLLLGTHLVTTGLNLFHEAAWSMRRLGVVTVDDGQWDTEMLAGVIPPSSRSGVGLFVQDEWAGAERCEITFGFRADRIEARAPYSPEFHYSGVRHTDTHCSFSSGLLYRLTPDTNLFANYGSAFRSPSLLERFFYGAHQDSVDIGNPNLRPEVGRNVDFGIRTRGNWYSVAISVFHNRIDDYIAALRTGTADPETGLEIDTWTNVGKVTLKGAELEGKIWFSESISYHGSVSMVRGTDDLTGDDLPEIPPVKIVNAIETTGFGGPAGSRAWVRGSVVITLRQDRVAALETETAGHTVFNVFAGLDWKRLSLQFAGRNLTDKSYHDHLSRVTYMNEQAGRTVDVNMGWRF